MFVHHDKFRSVFPELRRLNEGNIRYYKIDGDLSYPSITSVISFINAEKFAKWRAKVGEEEANRKSKHATTRGT